MTTKFYTNSRPGAGMPRQHHVQLKVSVYEKGGGTPEIILFYCIDETITYYLRSLSAADKSMLKSAILSILARSTDEVHNYQWSHSFVMGI